MSIGAVHAPYTPIEIALQNHDTKGLDKVEVLSEYEEGFKRELAPVEEQILRLKR